MNTKDNKCLYKVNIDYAKEKYNNLKKEFVESAIYYYIERYKESVNQLIENNIEFANNIYYEFIITDKFIIDNCSSIVCIGLVHSFISLINLTYSCILSSSSSVFILF